MRNEGTVKWEHSSITGILKGDFLQSNNKGFYNST